MSNSLAAPFVDQELLPLAGLWGSSSAQLPGALRSIWAAVCREAAASGRVEDLHAIRDDIRSVFDRYLGLLRNQIGLLDLHDKLAGRNGFPDRVRDELTRAADDLARIREDIFSRWGTADDLAEMIIGYVSLSHAELKELAAKYPPPQSWYEETIDPFAE